jgi:hypothetical protein
MMAERRRYVGSCSHLPRSLGHFGHQATFISQQNVTWKEYVKKARSALEDLCSESGIKVIFSIHYTESSHPAGGSLFRLSFMQPGPESFLFSLSITLSI